MAQAPPSGGLLSQAVYRHDCGAVMAGNKCDWDGQEITLTLVNPELGVLTAPQFICARTGVYLTFIRFITT